MSKINYPANSPYSDTPQYSWRIGRFVFRAIPPDSNDQLYTLNARHQYKPGQLAYELYGNFSYWWVFSVRNPFLRSDPVWNFVSGLTIVVPSPAYLSSILGA